MWVALLVVRPLFMLGLGDRELGVLGEVVENVVTPLKDRIEELTEKISELERVIEQQGYDRLAESIAASPVPLLLAVPEQQYSAGRRSPLNGGSDGESDQQRPRKKLPVPGRKRVSESTLEEGEIQIMSSSTTSSVSFSPEPKGAESLVLDPRAKESIDEISETKSNFSEFDRASTMSKSYESLVDSRYASAEESRLSPDKTKPSTSLKLPQKKTPSNSPSSVKEPNLDPLQENVVLSLNPPPTRRDTTFGDELEKTPEPILDTSLPTPVATPIPLVPTPIPCLGFSEYQSLFEQNPTSNCQLWVESVGSEEIPNVNNIEIPEPIPNQTTATEQPTNSQEVERLLKSRPPKTLVRTASVDELVSKFEHIDHEPLSNETASSKRSIFQQRRRNRSPDKSGDVGFLVVESVNDSVTDSSLEKVTQVDPGALTPYTLSPWNSFYLNEDPRDSKKSMGHSFESPDFSEAFGAGDISLNLKRLDEDVEPEIMKLSEPEINNESNEENNQLAVPEQSFSNSPPPVKLPEIVPSPVSPTPSDPPPSYPPSPDTPQKGTFIDQYASSENEEALNPAPVRSSSLKDSDYAAKKSRRFSVQNIIKKFDSSSDSEKPRREKSSPSPINILLRKIVSGKRKKFSKRPVRHIIRAIAHHDPR